MRRQLHRERGKSLAGRGKSQAEAPGPEQVWKAAGTPGKPACRSPEGEEEGTWIEKGLAQKTS